MMRETRAPIQRLAASGLRATSDAELRPLPAPIAGFRGGGGPTLARQNAEVLECPRPDFKAKAKGPHPFPSPLPPMAGRDPGHSFYLATTKLLALGPTGKGSPGGRERKAEWIPQVAEGLPVPAWSEGQAQ